MPTERPPDDREVFQPEPEGLEGEEPEEGPQPVGDARLHRRDERLVDLVRLGRHAVQERLRGGDRRAGDVEHADDQEEVHHVEGGGAHLHAGAEVVPEQNRAAGHGDDPEQHAPEDEQQDQRRDEGRDDARKDAAVGVLFVPLRVRGAVEDLEQADDELRIDGDAVHEDEDEYPHARLAGVVLALLAPLVTMLIQMANRCACSRLFSMPGSSRACSSRRISSESMPMAIQLSERMPVGRLG